MQPGAVPEELCDPVNLKFILLVMGVDLIGGVKHSNKIVLGKSRGGMFSEKTLITVQARENEFLN